MCAINPIYMLDVSPSRLEKVGKVLTFCMSKMSNEQALTVFLELGFADAVVFGDDGTFRGLDLTAIQQVAAAYALLAALESGNKTVLNPDFRESNEFVI